MASAMTEDNGMVCGNGIEIVAGRVSFLSEKELVVAIATEPFSWSRGKKGGVQVGFESPQANEQC